MMQHYGIYFKPPNVLLIIFNVLFNNIALTVIIHQNLR